MPYFKWFTAETDRNITAERTKNDQKLKQTCTCSGKNDSNKQASLYEHSMRKQMTYVQHENNLTNTTLGDNSIHVIYNDDEQKILFPQLLH